MSVAGALMFLYALMFSVLNGIAPVWIVLALCVSALIAAMGLVTVFRTSPPGGDRSESWALTSDAIWRRKGARGHWEVLIPLSKVRRLDTGADDFRMIAPHCGATIRITDDRNEDVLMGPVHNPVRWTRLMVELGAARGVHIQAHDWPWVEQYEPYVEDEADAGSPAQQALQPDAPELAHNAEE